MAKSFKEHFIRIFADKDENGNISFKSLYLLIFWPLFGLAFQYAEKYYPVAEYHVVHSRFDDLIPFNELFLFPYMFWFVYMVGMHFYSFFKDRETFRKFVKFIIFTYMVTLAIYFIFPTCQELRPTAFERDNFLTRFMADFYRFDTNTNVCPSMHVIGAVAVMLAAHNIKELNTPLRRTAFDITTALICVSTVFLKQHSVIDVVAAIPLCIIGYVIFYRERAFAHKPVKIKAVE